MIDIEKIARKALTIIKLKYGLPTSGFVTGGSIANIMWEIVSGNKAVINDIDVFLYTPLSTKEKREKLVKYSNIERSYFESYKHISYTTECTDSYNINESTNNGIFNFVKYESNNKSPDLIISSFDINCTRIGYSIDENKFYYKDDFVTFLETGKLKVTSLNTPAHTAIRLIKKKHDLNAILNEEEINICQYILDNRKLFPDIDKVRFMKRYANMYEKHSDYLDKFFSLTRDISLEEFLKKTKNVDEEIYLLKTKEYPIQCNIDYITNKPITASEYLFYIRNIWCSHANSKIWDKLHSVYNRVDYIDYSASDSDINYLSELLRLYPLIINNIKGMKFNEQMYITRMVMNNVSKQYDIQTAIAVLENKKFDMNAIFDEDSCLLLGLSVRKQTKVSGEFNGIVF